PTNLTGQTSLGKPDWGLAAAERAASHPGRRAQRATWRNCARKRAVRGPALQAKLCARPQPAEYLATNACAKRPPKCGAGLRLRLSLALLVAASGLPLACLWLASGLPLGLPLGFPWRGPRRLLPAVEPSLRPIG